MSFKKNYKNILALALGKGKLQSKRSSTAPLIKADLQGEPAEKKPDFRCERSRFNLTLLADLGQVNVSESRFSLRYNGANREGIGMNRK